MNSMGPFPGGWVVIAERRDKPGRFRQFIAASNSEMEAIASVKRLIGNEYQFKLNGAADAVHFLRRGMKAGDVMEIGGKQASNLHPPA